MHRRAGEAREAILSQLASRLEAVETMAKKSSVASTARTVLLRQRHRPGTDLIIGYARLSRLLGNRPGDLTRRSCSTTTRLERDHCADAWKYPHLV